ncbi:YbhB/YbcL family Raf kinase inhibitor-like protein [[Mycoplasma] mobile]|nr:YbhB/YbcL family Raf kinase inhibitor-like protein [[Mycoplasma] mobile]
MKKNTKILISSSAAISALGIIPAAVIACGTTTETTESITSTSIVNGVLGKKFGAANDNGPLRAETPQLSFKSVTGATSYALVILDNEATNVIGVPFIHWAIANIKIKADANGMINIPENIASEANAAARALITQGRNSSFMNANSAIPGGFQRPDSVGYFSPFPPNAGHYYQISVLALDKEVTGLAEGFTLADLYSGIQTQGIKIVDRKYGDFFYNQVVQRQGSDSLFEHPANSLTTAPRLYRGVVPNIANIASTSVTNGNLQANFFNARTNGVNATADTLGQNSTIPNLSWNAVSGANSYLVTISNYSFSNINQAPFTNFVAVVPAEANTTNNKVTLPSQLANANSTNGVIYGKNSSSTDNVIATGGASLINVMLKQNANYFMPQGRANWIIVVNVYALKSNITTASGTNPVLTNGSHFLNEFTTRAANRDGIIAAGEFVFNLPGSGTTNATI